MIGKDSFENECITLRTFMQRHAITVITTRVLYFVSLALIRHMVKAKKGQHFVARELSIAKMEKLLLKNGSLIKSVREERTTLERFVYEINISRTQMIKYEAGGDMLLSTFLKLLHGLDIDVAEYFRELQNTSK